MRSPQPIENKQTQRSKCKYCRRFFGPRRGGRQFACLDPACQKKRKREQEQKWLKKYKKTYGKSYFAGDYERIRQYRIAHPGYQREWRSKKHREIQTLTKSEPPVKSGFFRCRVQSTLRLSEIQTLSLRLTRTKSGFQVDGYL